MKINLEFFKEIWFYNSYISYLSTFYQMFSLKNHVVNMLTSSTLYNTSPGKKCKAPKYWMISYTDYFTRNTLRFFFHTHIKTLFDYKTDDLFETKEKSITHETKKRWLDRKTRSLTNILSLYLVSRATILCEMRFQFDIIFIVFVSFLL